MPKTAKEIRDQKLYQSQEISDLVGQLEEASLYVDPDGPLYQQMVDYIGSVNKLLSSSEETIQEGLDELKDFNAFLMDKGEETQGKTNCEYFCSKLDDNGTKFVSALKGVNELLDFGMDLNAMLGNAPEEIRKAAGLEAAPQNAGPEINAQQNAAPEQDRRKEIHDKLASLEQAGNFRGMLKVFEEVADNQEERDYVMEYFDSWQEFVPEQNQHAIIPEKAEAFKKLCEETGSYRAEVMLELGIEKEKFAERIRKGEIPDTESIQGDENAIKAVANSYIDHTMEEKSHSLQAMIMPLEHAFHDLSSEWGDKWNKYAKDGSDAYLNSVEGKSPEEARRLVRLGDVADSNSSEKYGYKVNPEAGKEGQPLFTVSENRDILNKLSREGDKAISSKELDDIEENRIKHGLKYADVRVKMRDIAYAAQEKLAELDKMTKEGHQDTTTFTEMRDSLQKLANLDKNSDYSINGVRTLLNDLDRDSRQYEKAHDRIFRRRWGFGNDRFKMSRELQSFAKGLAADFNEFTKDLPDKGTKVDAILNFDRDVFGKVDDARKAKEINEKDLENKLGMNAPKADKKVQRKTVGPAPGNEIGSERQSMNNPEMKPKLPG